MNTMRDALVKAGKLQPVLCPYCGRNAKLVNGFKIYKNRPDLAEKNFWLCKPCDAYVGCHTPNRYNSFSKCEPLGRLADKLLRRAKSDAHNVFDEIWKSGRKTRTDAYLWLATQLQIKPEDCHIGMFDVEMCNKVQAVCASYWMK